MVDDSALRVRLEGRAEQLEAAVLRYRALVGALKSFTWKRRLRRVVEVLRAVAGEQAAVDEALSFVQRRAKVEAWPQGAILAAAKEADSLRAELLRHVRRRLDGDATRDLPADLDRLERLATNAPRLVMPGRRWEVACTALSPTLPQLQSAYRFGENLAQVFARPMEPRSVLQVKVTEWSAVEHGWADGTRALEAVWRKIDSLDVSGGVGRMLRRKARRLPRVEPAQGPTLLVYAEFWRALAVSRMEQISTARVEPAVPRPGEAFILFGWLVRRQAEATTTLELDAPRAGLLELAHLLSGSSQAAPHVRPWDSLERLATRADEDPRDPDWRRVHDALFLLARVASTPAKWLPPVYREGVPERSTLNKDASLRELVQALREHLLRPS